MDVPWCWAIKILTNMYEMSRALKTAFSQSAIFNSDDSLKPEKLNFINEFNLMKSTCFFFFAIFCNA